MPQVTLLFSRSHSIGALAIRLVTWGTWSHVGLRSPSGTVLQASWPGGVEEVSFEAFVARASRWEELLVEVPDPIAVIAWARSQRGKPYDLWGAVGLGLHRDWQADDAWWCSEYVEMALAHGGRPRFRAGLSRVTPEHSWMVN